MRKSGWMYAAMLLALGWGVAGADLPMENRHESFVLSGEIQIDSVYRNNQVDFSDDRRVTTGSLGTPRGAKAANDTVGNVDDENSFTNIEVTLSAYFALTENVSASVQLEGTHVTGADADGGYRGVDSDRDLNEQVEFNLHVEQAYIDVKDFFYEQLSWRIGQQDLVYGLSRDGKNEFLMNSSELGGRFVIRNGGVLDQAWSSSAGTGGVADIGETDDLDVNREAFAYKWTWNQEDQNWSADLFIAKLEEGIMSHTDHDMYALHVTVNPELGLTDKPTTVIGHLRNIRRKINSGGPLGLSELTEEAGDGADGRGMDFWSWGAGAQVYVLPELSLYGEFDVQAGDFNTDVTSAAGTEEDLSANAWYIGGRYDLTGGMEELGIYVEGQIGLYSGDSSATDDEEETYVNYGDNDLSMVVEENDYGYGLSANYEVFRIMGGFNVGKVLGDLGLELPGEWKLDGSWHWFTLNEDQILGANNSKNFGTNTDEDDLGSEFDLNLSWKYSDNLS
ncbi:MAG: hypothetical protein HY608_01505, partial [Planctomycetes bacterium]|nr:hypothetical protein [Planctomycetota bacterium]